jgi:hypothetical protein
LLHQHLGTYWGEDRESSIKALDQSQMLVDQSRYAILSGPFLEASEEEKTPRRRRGRTVAGKRGAQKINHEVFDALGE